MYVVGSITGFSTNNVYPSPRTSPYDRMTSTTITIRTSTEVKSMAQALFNDLGIDMSTAVNIFLRQAIRERGIPFMITTTMINFENGFDNEEQTEEDEI